MTYGPSRQSLSSAMTIVFKFIFPAIWIGGFSIGTIALLLSEPRMAGESAIGLLIGCLIFYWFGFPLKFVEIDEHYLYVSNYRKTILVPFSEIEDVSESPFINIHPVWVKFKTPTEFGSKIMFMPYFDFGSLFMMPHPVVAKLKKLAELIR